MILDTIVAFARRRLTAMTTILVGAHAAMVGLHLIGRAAPAIAPTQGLSGALGLVDDWWWITVHAIIAVGLIAAIGMHSWRVGTIAASLSAVTWALWMGLLMAWSMQTVPPVSLTAPVLGLVVVLPLSVLVGVSWSDSDLDD